MMTAPDAATAAGYGDRPASAGQQLRMIGWRRLVKGPLRGFLTVELWPPGLQVIDCPVLVSNGRAWCALPGKLQVDSNGRQRTDAAGKPLYTAVLQWCDRAVADRFSAAAISALRRTYPDALDGEGKP